MELATTRWLTVMCRDLDAHDEASGVPYTPLIYVSPAQAVRKMLDAKKLEPSASYDSSFKNDS